MSLYKFFAAYRGEPHQLAAVNMLADSMPSELLEKCCDWISCFEVDGEVDPIPSYTHKGYSIRNPEDL